MHDGLGDGLFELSADVGDVCADVDGDLAQMLVSWCALIQVVIHLHTTDAWSETGSWHLQCTCSFHSNRNLRSGTDRIESTGEDSCEEHNSLGAPMGSHSHK